MTATAAGGAGLISLLDSQTLQGRRSAHIDTTAPLPHTVSQLFGEAVLIQYFSSFSSLLSIYILIHLTL